MNNILRMGCASLLLVATVGCGSKNYKLNVVSDQKLSDYRVVEVMPFENNVEEFQYMEPEEQEKIKEYVSLLKGSLEEQLQKKGYSLADSGHRLVVKGSVVMLDPGNRALRYLVGFGAGSGKVRADIAYLNQDKTLAKSEVEAGMSIGFFGGDFKSALNKLSKQIIKQLETN